MINCLNCKYPFVHQNESDDCGVACITMVFRKLVGYIRYNTVVKKCELGYGGMSLQSILNGARQLGLNVYAFYATKDFLSSATQFPLIAFVNNNHYIVIYKIFKRNRQQFIIVGDPAYGIRQYSLSDFSNIWLESNTKGILINIEKTKASEFYVERKISYVDKIRPFKSFILLNKNSLFFLCLSLILISIIQILLPFLTKNIVDKGIRANNINFIWLIFISQMTLVISKSFMDISRSQIALYLSSKFSIELISSFLRKLFKMPMCFFIQRKIGDLIQRMDDNSRFVSFLSTDIVTISISLVSFVVSCFVLSYFDIRIFLIYIICIFAYWLWTSLFLNIRKKLDYEYFSQRAAQSNSMYELFDSIEEIKLQGCVNKKCEEFKGIYFTGLKIGIKRLSIFQMNQIGAVLLNQGRDVLISVVTSLLVIKGELTLGALLAVQYVIGQLESPIDQIINFVYKCQDLSIASDRMSLIYDGEEEVTKDHEHITQLSCSHDIKIDNLWFKYNSYDKGFVLQNVSFTIPHNKVTAIVGLSGSGKSTLLKLILGYFQPSQGQITIGEKNLNSINLKEWRKLCGVVMQDGYIFSDTIENNIAISDEEGCNYTKLLKVTELTTIDDVIKNTPMQYKTKIGKDGRGLSKGQKQKILISRVLYKNPNYIFLDEATNSLDTKSEKIITENLERFFYNRTVMVIAHRMSTIKSADQIIVLDKGEIAEIGTHKDLLLRKGRYYDLVSNQLELGD